MKYILIFLAVITIACQNKPKPIPQTKTEIGVVLEKYYAPKQKDFLGTYSEQYVVLIQLPSGDVINAYDDSDLSTNETKQLWACVNLKDTVIIIYQENNFNQYNII